MIILNRNSKKLLLLQRNELLSKIQKNLKKKFGRFIFTNFLINFFVKKNIENYAEKLFQNEINNLEKFLPKRANNIMDIGCGLGIINIFLNRLYKGKPNFFLLDKNKVDKKIVYGFSKNYESYNHLNETTKILLNNGLKKEQLNIFDVDKKIHIDKQMDLVISLKSMGYHYPFENYLKLFKSCCNKDTIFIFDISIGTNNEYFFKKYFDEVRVFYEEPGIHYLKRIYCKFLKIKI